jgi:hypothetical protein
MKRIGTTTSLIAKAAVLWAATMLAGSAFADAPTNVRVRSIAYAGSGCPAGTVAENISPDAQAFTLLFDSFIAEAGPGVPFIAKRKNCQINIDLAFPGGWSFTLAHVDYRGYAALEKKVVGLQKSTYYFQGSASTAALQSKLVGPKDENYHYRDTLALSALVWSPCGGKRALNINSEVRVDNSASPYKSGLMTIDSIDGTLVHVYTLQWRRC